METRVYMVKKELANKIVDDPEVKRYGEARVFDSSALELKGGDSVLLVRGESSVFETELFAGLEEAKDKKEILKKVEELDNAAASGVGMLFG
jgi:hypothetical protein